MHYYRKATAVFIIVLTLIMPLFLDKEEQTAVVNLDQVVAASKHLSQIKQAVRDKSEKRESSLRAAEKEIMKILRREAEIIAAENSYSSIIIDQAVYQGGKNISQEIADKIDNKYK
ncbi:hypothetical protein [Halanaerobium sp.]|jgi:hypothetical protein|uniref:hypothetical protein n=1 Tax=Halanaerobium sp. TaxID=1895664 RepID=UPI000DE625BE|nr:hypothetical protein [Halanaerobium sp.]PUU95543.1 MAG: hypothetical protein CI949_34 [Halanaerobium sp.]PUU95664.1 MAG: hypothetical protein CI947_131 [Halanaerobium sp.]